MALPAAVTITFLEVGSDVVATTNGGINAGWSRDFTDIAATGNGSAVIDSTSVRATPVNGIRWISNIGHWSNTSVPGLTSLINTGPTSSGDTFGCSSDQDFYTPAGISEGDAFTRNTTITWTGQTFQSLGVDNIPTSPLVVSTLDNVDTINLVRAIPKPSTYATICGILMLTLALWRRRKRSSIR